MSDDQSRIDQMWYDWFVTDAFQSENGWGSSCAGFPATRAASFAARRSRASAAGSSAPFSEKNGPGLNPRFCNYCDDFANKHRGGHEVEMSMLFADVRGSTALSERMSPTEFSRLINRFFVEASGAIIREDGLLEKLAGDAVAAFWGSGIAGPNYVSRTIRAAQDIQKIMREQNIPVGVGVHAGVAYFGAMGSEDGLVNISAIGDEVNLAARLASKAAAGEIILSERALAKAGMDGNALEARRLELKGISEPVPVRVMRG
ncbi:MAG: adenylate/guanylate cyclase domain-containing protein [Chloroflexi bacterium]|nr:adenylate/guanylate cyclase domain-containing protein [Chloroflexota bacterium]